MQILITGGAGFIGSNLADALLADGHEIVVFDNFNDYYDPAIKEANVAPHLGDPRYALVRGDLEDAAAVKALFDAHPFGCVVHLAARAGVRPSLENPAAYVRTNVLGTTNVLDQMRAHGVKKLVFASSSSVYGNCPEETFSEGLKVTEPISPYAATKSACEQICYTYCHLYGIQTVCLRFFTVYGPRQRPDLAIRKFVEKIERGEPIEMYGDGTTKRDYTFIADIVKGIRAAIAYDATPYEIVNLGGGEPIQSSGYDSCCNPAARKAVEAPQENPRLNARSYGFISAPPTSVFSNGGPPRSGRPRTMRHGPTRQGRKTASSSRVPPSPGNSASAPDGDWRPKACAARPDSE